MELRIELSDDDLIAAVLAARKHADPSVSRTALVEQVLREWARKELHTATVIVRLAGSNAVELDPKRRAGG